MNNLVNMDLDLEQLKLQIMQMKEGIARKERKLQKCERAAKNRSNINKTLDDESDVVVSKTANQLNGPVVNRPEPSLSSSEASCSEQNGLNSIGKQIEISSKAERDGTERNNGSDCVGSEPLRRSSRVSRKSRLLRREELGSIAQRESQQPSKEDCVRAKRASAPNGLFPSLPKSLVFSITDFVLPDSEYAALKLQVRKTKKLLCLRDNYSIDPNDGSIDSSASDRCQRWTINNRLECSQREPVLMVHCGHLRHDSPITICVVVQVTLITTWISQTYRNWVKFDECRLDLRDCPKLNICQLQTKSAFGTVCVRRNKTVWIHACDCEKRVTLRQIDVRTGRGSDVDDEHNILSCTLGNNELVLAFVASSEKSNVNKYSLSSNLNEIIKETTFEVVVNDELNSLVCVSGLESACLGTSRSKLYLWNGSNGKLVKVIEPQGEEFNFETCTLCVAQNGLLFLGLIYSYPKCESWIVVVNPNTLSWRRVTRYSADPNLIVPKQETTGKEHFEMKEIRQQGQFLFTLGTMAAAIWHLRTRKLLAFVTNSHTVDSLTVCQRNCCSDQIQIIVASNTGHLAIYSAATDEH